MLRNETGKQPGFPCGILSHDPLLSQPINQSSAVGAAYDIVHASAFAARQGKADMTYFRANVCSSQTESAPPQPATKQCSCAHSSHLRADKCRHPCRRNACKSIGKCSSQGNGGIGKRCGSREPVCGGYVETHGIGDGLRCASDATENRQQKAECRNSFRQPLAGPCSDVGRELPDR